MGEKNNEALVACQLAPTHPISYEGPTKLDLELKMYCGLLLNSSLIQKSNIINIYFYNCSV
jgi:hypothetical protein